MTGNKKLSREISINYVSISNVHEVYLHCRMFNDFLLCEELMRKSLTSESSRRRQSLSSPKISCSFIFSEIDVHRINEEKKKNARSLF